MSGLPPTTIVVKTGSSGSHRHKKSTSGTSSGTHKSRHKKSNHWHIAATDTTPGYTVTLNPDGSVTTRLTTKGPRHHKGTGKGHHKPKHDPGVGSTPHHSGHPHKKAKPPPGVVTWKPVRGHGGTKPHKPRQPKAPGGSHKRGPHGKGHGHVTNALLGVSTPGFRPPAPPTIGPSVVHLRSGRQPRHAGSGPHHFNPSTGFL